MYQKFFLIILSFFFISCDSGSYDIVIKNGQIFDGSGGDSKLADIAIIGNTIVKVGVVLRKNIKP